MKLQELLDSTDLDVSESQVKAYFLGGLCAEKPASMNKAIDDLISDDPEARKAVEAPLKAFWENLQKNKKHELSTMFPIENDLEKFLDSSRDLIDEFLTGMSLAGTNIEKCKDEELMELIEVLEEYVEEIDDLLSDFDKEAAADLKENLLENWTEFSQTVK